MSFSCVYIRQIGEKDEPFAMVGTDEYGNILNEPWDGSSPVWVTAHSLTVYEKTANSNRYVENGKILNNKIEVMISDSRVAFRCEKYDKGGNWYGGLTALALNGIERAAAAHRRAGKILVGMVRYEWLEMVGYDFKHSFLSDERLVLWYQFKKEAAYKMVLTFKKSEDAKALANIVAQRTAVYRMNMADEKSEKELAFFPRFINGEQIPPSADPDKQYSTLKFPTYYKVPYGAKFRPVIPGVTPPEQIAQAQQAQTQQSAAPQPEQIPQAPQSAPVQPESIQPPYMAPPPQSEDIARQNEGTQTGSPAAAETQSRPEDAVAGYCPNCGNPIKPFFRFCSGCGKPVEWD